MARLEYTFKSDILFKILFIKAPGLLKHLVAMILGIKYENIERFEITNPEIPPEEIGKKFCRLDITMVVNGKRVDLEIQVEDERDYRNTVRWRSSGIRRFATRWLCTITSFPNCLKA